MNKSKDKRRKGFKIPDDVKKLAKLSFKKFKKENRDYYDSKKELKSAYYAQMYDLLPSAISTIIKYGHIPEMKDVKEAIYDKLLENGNVNPIKYTIKQIKKGLEFDNMELLPNIIYEIIENANRYEAEVKANAPDPDAVHVTFPMEDVVELSHLILKKKIKKMVKAGIDENVAFDVLSTIPTTKILQKSQYFHIRKLFTVLYEHVKTKDIDFSKIMKVVFKNGDYVSSVITFALLERKEKIGNFTDSQKKLFNDITEYCFKTMEDMKKEDIHAILKAYIDSRKKDEAQGKDTNRRYYISSLPESDYPKIAKTVKRIIERDESMKKYF